MSAERFIQYRERIGELWVDAQACVLALEQSIRKSSRNASVLKWLIFGTGLLTGAAGLDFLNTVFSMTESSGRAVVSGLAFLTAAFTGAVPLLAFDEKIKKHTDAKHKLNEIQTKMIDFVYVRMERPLEDSDGLEIARMSEQVADLLRMDNFQDSQYRASAQSLKNLKAFSKVEWQGPASESDAGQGGQGQSDDLRPLTRG